ncbi:MAG: hypothetical protein VX527_01545 [Planctomycetota bacterium]|nr:hypothetical protein [Planctomycetota bacterium]
MFRNICAVLVGLVAGMVFNMLIVMLSMVLYPMPEGVGWNDREGLAAYIETLPATAFLIVMLAHLGQAFFGGWIAALISRNNPMLVAMVIGVLSMLAGLYNLSTLPAPAWMWIEVPLYLVAAWAAARLVLARRTAHQG